MREATYPGLPSRRRIESMLRRECPITQSTRGPSPEDGTFLVTAGWDLHWGKRYERPWISYTRGTAARDSIQPPEGTDITPNIWVIQEALERLGFTVHSRNAQIQLIGYSEQQRAR